VPLVPDSPRWGLTLPFAGVPPARIEPLVRRAEAAGWDDLSPVLVDASRGGDRKGAA
jgi:hypothetical protein